MRRFKPLLLAAMYLYRRAFTRLHVPSCASWRDRSSPHELPPPSAARERILRQGARQSPLPNYWEIWGHSVLTRNSNIWNRAIFCKKQGKKFENFAIVFSQFFRNFFSKAAARKSLNIFFKVAKVAESKSPKSLRKNTAAKVADGVNYLFTMMKSPYF